ncbi:hypothetical protein LCGC14_2476530, partial [marine sediment metagenome]
MSLTTVILPCCGKATRFGKDIRPKFLLTHPNSNSMLTQSIKGLDLTNVDKIYISVLKEHVDEYKFIEGLRRQINDDRVEFFIIDKSTSQPDTVATTIASNSIFDNIFIKDVDNYFEFEIPYGGGNYVTTYSLNQCSYINPINKSYLLKNNKDYICNIVEKDVISDQFCCGGYGFAYSDEYLQYYNKLSNNDNLYISNIIQSMV